MAINSSMSRFSHSFTYQSNKYLNVHVSGILGKQGRHNTTLMELHSSRDGQYTHIHLSQLIVCMHWNLSTALKLGTAGIMPAWSSEKKQGKESVYYFTDHSNLVKRALRHRFQIVPLSWDRKLSSGSSLSSNLPGPVYVLQS